MSRFYWFYFKDYSGKTHFADSRQEAERIREQVGGGHVIIKTDRSSFQQVAPSSPLQSNAINIPVATAHSQIEQNDLSWLLNYKELVYGQNRLVPALQIYHPTASSIHGESDRRVLRLKDSIRPAIAHYALSLKHVLPKNQSILLCCAPGSSSRSTSGIAEIIKSISGGDLVDGSKLLTTSRDRQRKSSGARFSDDELMSTITLNAKPIMENSRILLIDDVVTSGQTLRVCCLMIAKAYPNHNITRLSISSTDYESKATGIADMIVVSSIGDALSPLHKQPATEPALARQHTHSYSHPNNTRTQPVQHKAIDKRPVANRPIATGSSSQKQGSTSPGSTSSDCFVITAIYNGDSDHPNVQRIRNFRDEKIANIPMGGCAIKMYKALGPIMAILVMRLGLQIPLRYVVDLLLRLTK